MNSSPAQQHIELQTSPDNDKIKHAFASGVGDFFSLTPADQKNNLAFTLLSHDGYNENFLSAGVPLPLLQPADLREGFERNGKGTFELKYTHFSMVINSSRKIPYFTAINIDAAIFRKWKNSLQPSVGNSPRKWAPETAVKGDNFISWNYYKMQHFDIRPYARPRSIYHGEMANRDKRLATSCSFMPPVSTTRGCGITARAAQWQNQEASIVRSVRGTNFKASVFAGPLLSGNGSPVTNTNNRPVPQYWKLVVREKNETIHARAYLTGNEGSLTDMFVAAFSFGDSWSSQISIDQLEKITGMNFNGLGKFELFSPE
jgi:endonuclease G, mitochondrial